ncbi:MAG: hypothetical protein WKF68_11460 [Daejeonella sp.]
MKKIIITIAVAASISLGFTIIDKTANNTARPTAETVSKSDFDQSDEKVKQEDKRIASWD